MSTSQKKFLIPGDRIVDLIPQVESCMASDRITVDGSKGGYMYRELPRDDVDSGWTFMSGDETQEYAGNPANWAIYEVNTICNYDRTTIPYLNASPSSAFGRVPDSDRFDREDFAVPDD